MQSPSFCILIVFTTLNLVSCQDDYFNNTKQNLSEFTIGPESDEDGGYFTWSNDDFTTNSVLSGIEDEEQVIDETTTVVEYKTTRSRGLRVKNLNSQIARTSTTRAFNTIVRAQTPPKKKTKVKTPNRGLFFTKHDIPFQIERQSQRNQLEILSLINYVAKNYLNECVNIILYDDYYEKKLSFLKLVLKDYPTYYINGKIFEDSETTGTLLIPQEGKCSSFLILITDIIKAGTLLGNQSISKVVVLSDASVWKIKEFLSLPYSQGLVNLLVIANSYMDGYKRDINLYTHDLWRDESGSSAPVIVTSWRKGKLSNEVPLFPQKMLKGFNGFKFTVSVRDQPPFVIKRSWLDEDGNNVVSWDGVEIRLLRLLSDRLNFSILFQEPPKVDEMGIEATGVIQELLDGRADIGASGMYITPDRVSQLDMSKGHTIDCASFITLTSTALPRYRAIMGPFHWTVWLGLTLVYLFAIFPLTFSYRHSLRHLLRDPWEMENMFWYVFGTFTNCFTFSGAKSWSTSTKHTTRLIVGWYWAFSIIITACYTGSVIAFITIPVFPSVIDTSSEIYWGGYTVGTLDRGGWGEWFLDSADPITNKIFENIDYVPDVISGLKNVTSNYFWPYAFLGSRAWLEYVVQANYSVAHVYKRALLHIGSECFVPFNVALGFPPKATYGERIDRAVLRATQSGLMLKLLRDVEWEVQRSATGKLLQASSGASLRLPRPEDRQLNLDDVQGTFLLLGAGFLIGAAILICEWFCLGGQKKFMHKGEQPTFAVTRELADDDSYDDAMSIPEDGGVYMLSTMSLEQWPEERRRMEGTVRERRVQSS